MFFLRAHPLYMCINTNATLYYYLFSLPLMCLAAETLFSSITLRSLTAAADASVIVVVARHPARNRYATVQRVAEVSCGDVSTAMSRVIRLTEQPLLYRIQRTVHATRTRSPTTRVVCQRVPPLVRSKPKKPTRNTYIIFILMIKK